MTPPPPTTTVKPAATAAPTGVELRQQARAISTRPYQLAHAVADGNREATPIPGVLNFAQLRRFEHPAAKFARIDMSSATLRDAVIPDGDFTAVRAANTNFSAARLQRTHWAKARLGKARFISADLTGANFEEVSDLAGADFAGAWLTAARFTSDALMRAHEVDKAHLEGAIVDGKTLDQAAVDRFITEYDARNGNLPEA